MKSKFARGLIALLCAPFLATAASPMTTPEEVAAAIDAEGAQTYLASLDEASAERLFANIQTGRASWVALAPKLAVGADAANAEGLGIALAYALPKNSAAVLNAVAAADAGTPALAVSRVCGMPFIEGTTKQYRQKALRAVAAARGVMPSVRQRCLQALRTAKQ